MIRTLLIGLLTALTLTACTQTRVWNPDDYTVRSGDTLYSIAWRYELDPVEFARWNGLRSPYEIRPGDRLHTNAADAVVSKSYVAARDDVPKGKVRVRQGDTLYSLAKQANLTTEQLATRNDLSKPYVIYPGQILQLETSAVSSPVTVGTKKPGTEATTANRKTAPSPTSTAAKSRSVNFRWVWPTEGKLIKRFNRHRIDARGIGIAGTDGKEIRAAAPGRVVYSGDGLTSYGNLIIIKHNDTYLSAYAHNRRLLVKEGQVVKSGQMIAEMGKTGTEKTHLHFEIRRLGKPVDPLSYLPSS